MKNKGYIVLITLITAVLIPELAHASYGDVGFWSGLWQGITFPFRLFLKLIWTDITIYEQFNSTYWYHVGYIIGVLTIIGGSSGASN